MKRALLLGPALLISATPAHATGGFDCWTRDRGIVLYGSFGNSPGTPIDAVMLEIGRRTMASGADPPQLFIIRSWFDEQEIRIDLSDRNSDNIDTRLRVRFVQNRVATGTLERDGVPHPVRCEMERMDL